MEIVDVFSLGSRACILAAFSGFALTGSIVYSENSANEAANVGHWGRRMSLFLFFSLLALSLTHSPRFAAPTCRELTRRRNIPTLFQFYLSDDHI
jgi:hypothetical protein